MQLSNEKKSRFLYILILKHAWTAIQFCKKNVAIDILRYSEPIWMNGHDRKKYSISR